MSQNTPRPDDRTQYGGQAVVEGVMMRSPRYFAIACRRQSDGQIIVKLENVENTFRKFMWLNKPFLRGTLALVDAFLMGYRALIYSANIQMADSGDEESSEAPAAGAVNLAMGEGAPVPAHHKKDDVPRVNLNQPINKIAIGATTVLALLFGFLIFWALPAILSNLILPHHTAIPAVQASGLHTILTPRINPDVPSPKLFDDAKHQIAGNLLEGFLRVVFFLGYIAGISRMKNVQRVFQYHGAEHKAINALEAGLPLTVENARAASRIHPRCGTNFIFIVLITSIIVFSFVPIPVLDHGDRPLFVLHMLRFVLLRLVLLPVVAGIAFEILKFAGKHRDKKWAMAMIAPGLATQYLTTRVPDDSQIEVALASLSAVWDKEHETSTFVTTQSQAADLDEPAAELA